MISGDSQGQLSCGIGERLDCLNYSTSHPNHCIVIFRLMMKTGWTLGLMISGDSLGQLSCGIGERLDCFNCPTSHPNHCIVIFRLMRKTGW
ncbi:hypothetical protein CDAR_415281 [Caerostris darwini]|uniref:Uncharacterized protein n=1 Tax=Caerostris darwini TaxID=1538125 RepID=A0AAV4MMI8_9ARAC|nr:hypothetical protein CDAR_415281 [Caerostris darwini]